MSDTAIYFFLPQAIDRIARDVFVAGDEGQAFASGLGDQQAVERIAVDIGKRSDAEGVGFGDGKDGDTLGAIIGNHVHQRGAERQFAQVDLDSHFPNTGGADRQGMPTAIDGVFSDRAQLRIVFIVPNKSVGIEQQAHY